MNKQDTKPVYHRSELGHSFGGIDCEILRNSKLRMHNSFFQNVQIGNDVVLPIGGRLRSFRKLLLGVGDVRLYHTMCHSSHDFRKVMLP